MKIYTKKGDDGHTSLFGGSRVSKDARRIDAYGTVDELNTVLGVCLAHKPSAAVQEVLMRIQQQLFVAGADLATPSDARNRIDRIGDSEIGEMEKVIDDLQQQLPPLKQFILPGGNLAGATLHLARTVCRRAEREAVACHASDQVNPKVIVYLNRLSDLLFVLARYENQQSGQAETPWEPERSR